MEFKFDAAVLRPLLALAESLTEERSPQAALSNILLDLSGGRLTISATDFRSTLVVSTLVDEITPGSILVPGKTFSKWVSRIDGSIKAKLTDTTFRLKSGNSQLTLKTMPASEYPALSFKDTTDIGSLHASTLIEILKKAIISADPNDAMPARNAVALDVADAISADGVRLSRVAIYPPLMQTAAPILISRSALSDLLRSIAHTDILSISFDSRRLVLRSTDFLYAVQTVDATYFDWRQFFKSPISNLITVPTADLKSAVLRIAETNSDVPWIRFGVEPDLLTLDNMVIGNDSITHGIESISISTAESWETHVNLNFVRDILTVCTSSEIQIGLLPLGENNMIAFLDGELATFVVAPMAIGASA